MSSLYCFKSSSRAGEEVVIASSGDDKEISPETVRTFGSAQPPPNTPTGPAVDGQAMANMAHALILGV